MLAGGASSEDYRNNLALKARNGITNNGGKKFKKNLNTFSVVSNSDVSTTVVANSCAAKGPKHATCNSVNFGEMGDLIDSTAREKNAPLQFDVWCHCFVLSSGGQTSAAKCFDLP